MLRNLNDFENFTISATDGPIGHVKDCYFDDDTWAVRYFVVETGSWLSSKKVLISPMSAHRPDWTVGTLPVAISKEQVKHSPDIDTDKPVSRQNETAYLVHYGYAPYWDGDGLWGEGMYANPMSLGDSGHAVGHVERERQLEAYLRAERKRHRNDDPHLRSGNALVGYQIDALDGHIGHVAGILFHDETWALRYLVVQTGHWWAGHKVLIAPSWIAGVHWSDRTVTVSVSRASVRTAPPYDMTIDWGWAEDRNLYQHHGRDDEWLGHVARESDL